MEPKSTLESASQVETTKYPTQTKLSTIKPNLENTQSPRVRLSTQKPTPEIDDTMMENEEDLNTKTITQVSVIPTVKAITHNPMTMIPTDKSLVEFDHTTPHYDFVTVSQTTSSVPSYETEPNYPKPNRTIGKAVTFKPTKDTNFLSSSAISFMSRINQIAYEPLPLPRKHEKGLFKTMKNRLHKFYERLSSKMK